MKKKISVGLCLSLIIISIALTFSLTMVYSKQIYNSIISNISQRAQTYEGAEEINKIISNYYYGDLNEYNKNLSSAVAEGYVNGLKDANSVYMTSDEYITWKDRLENGITGAGIETSYNFLTNQFVVSYVYDDSPAQRAGIEAGDIITAVDNVAATRFNYKTLAKKFYGTKLQTVTVEYRREDFTKTEQILMGFTIPSVTGEIKGEVAYVRISRFYANTAQELEKVLTEMKEAGVTGVIFDLRNTQEGTIKYAANAIDVVVPNISGSIAVARDKNGKDKERFTAQSSHFSMKFVVLINSGTTGPAELFACNLRDISYAQLVGSTTAGVGTMQEVFTLNDGSAILLTVALIVPKNGEEAVYDKVGVAPTLEVTLMGDDSDLLMIDEKDDNQLQAALNILTQV